MENEIRILEINKKEWQEKLETLGAKKVGDWTQKRCTFDFFPPVRNKWIRLRTNGEETTLTIKEVQDKTKIDGTREIEIVVSDFEKTKEILKELGYTPKSTQINKRIRYMYKGVEIDIDEWPLIPPYIEIEGKTKEEVERILKMLDVDQKKVTTMDVQSIYEEIYHIPLNFKTLTFEEQIR